MPFHFVLFKRINDEQQKMRLKYVSLHIFRLLTRDKERNLKLKKEREKERKELRVKLIVHSSESCSVTSTELYSIIFIKIDSNEPIYCSMYVNDVSVSFLKHIAISCGAPYTRLY